MISAKLHHKRCFNLFIRGLKNWDFWQSYLLLKRQYANHDWFYQNGIENLVINPWFYWYIQSNYFVEKVCISYHVSPTAWLLQWPPMLKVRDDKPRYVYIRVRILNGFNAMLEILFEFLEWCDTHLSFNFCCSSDFRTKNRP